MVVIVGLFISLLLINDPAAGVFKEFDDSVLFKLSWQQESPALQAALKQYRENGPATVFDSDAAVVLISTGGDEKYLCSLPRDPETEKTKTKNYQGPSPGELMTPLYNQRSCTYRMEQYWAYELCHGRFFMQYHEEKDPVKGKLIRTEYYLGQFMSDRTAEDDAAFDQLNPPKRKVEDQLLPYYPVRFTQGTVCDITGKPRQTTIHYVCIVDAKNHQIYSVDEVSSCEYEVVVLTNRLCTHPGFEPDVPEEHDIACVPLDGASVKPTALIDWEKEQQWDFQQQFASQIPGIKPLRGTEDTGDDGDDGTEEVEPKRSGSRPQEAPQPKVSAPPPVDQQLASSFLSGEYCLYGGAGWWKHEYCHGKQVLQFHEDPQVGRLEIVLGKWDKDVHLKWIQENPHKKPIKVDGRIRQVSHIYVNGDFCDTAGVKRTVEVRLRCRETQGNQNSVTLYLLEPQVCEYVLGVESAMLCDLLQSATEDGLLGQS